jgi:hypothetical protein
MSMISQSNAISQSVDNQIGNICRVWAFFQKMETFSLWDKVPLVLSLQKGWELNQGRLLAALSE